MTLLLILLGLLLILVILKLFTEMNIEGFEDIPLNPYTIQKYKQFLSFYNPFCTNWDKAITSSTAAEIPQEPLTDPSQVSESGSVPSISIEQKNQYITILSQLLNQQFPPICETMPDILNSANISQIIEKLPQDKQLFINALNWMNSQLQKAQAKLGDALQGKSSVETNTGSEKVEGFEDCQDISKCLLNNPELLQKIATGISDQNAQPIKQQEEELIAKITPFLNTSELLQAFNENKILMEKAKDIQNQAQSGELVKQINVPGGNTIATYQKPPGANNMVDMKKNNPDRYNELKTNYSQWYSLKSMLDSINGSL
jgi:hypothetical protein